MNIRGLEQMNKTFSPRTFEQMNYNVEPINMGGLGDQVSQGVLGLCCKELRCRIGIMLQTNF